ncbi:MAG: GNAT family N-acetyltransferase [Clostridiales bacterium]|nr:GNAT family N-acetyltransferase [Clostridiales bacterium]
MKYYPQVLETERLILRPITPDDKHAIFKWAGDPEVSKFMIYPNYTSPDDADLWIEGLYGKETDLDYGFVWKETGELIGSGGLYYRPENDTWRLGYNIRRDMWGRGIATEACRKIIEYARGRFTVRRIESTFAEENLRSGRVMEKLGMTYMNDGTYSKIDGSATFRSRNYGMDIK